MVNINDGEVQRHLGRINPQPKRRTHKRVRRSEYLETVRSNENLTPDIYDDGDYETEYNIYDDER
jgi:hypothetical protein